MTTAPARTTHPRPSTLHASTTTPGPIHTSSSTTIGPPASAAWLPVACALAPSAARGTALPANVTPASTCVLAPMEISQGSWKWQRGPTATSSPRSTL